MLSTEALAQKSDDMFRVVQAQVQGPRVYSNEAGGNSQSEDAWRDRPLKDSRYGKAGEEQPKVELSGSGTKNRTEQAKRATRCRLAWNKQPKDTEAMLSVPSRACAAGASGFAAGSGVVGVGRSAPPNPSFERTCNGMAPGPRGAHCVYAAPRGPGAMPLPAAQFER